MAHRIQRPCKNPLCGKLNCTEHPEYNTPTRQPDLRPTAARRGYGAAWQKRRAAFLATHPYCEDCGAKATDVDHIPSRRVLVERGEIDPDAEKYLHPKCHSCHSKKTTTVDGGWGRGDKNLKRISR